MICSSYFIVSPVQNLINSLTLIALIPFISRSQSKDNETEVDLDSEGAPLSS